MEKSKENAGGEEKGNSEIQGQSSFYPPSTDVWHEVLMDNFHQALNDFQRTSPIFPLLTFYKICTIIISW